MISCLMSNIENRTKELNSVLEEAKTEIRRLEAQKAEKQAEIEGFTDGGRELAEKREALLNSGETTFCPAGSKYILLITLVVFYGLSVINLSRRVKG